MEKYQNIQQILNNDERRYGFILINQNESLFGILHGNSQYIINRFSVDLPKKRNYVGTKAIRYFRIRKEKRQNYLRKISETVSQCFIDNGKVNVDGIIIANAIQFNNELQKIDLFDPLIQSKIVQRVIISYGGQIGFNSAIELASETLENTTFIRQKTILNRFFDEISNDSYKYSYGLEETLKQLEINNIETLIIWQNLDITRCVLRSIQTGEIKILFKSQNQMKDLSIRENEITCDKFELIEQTGLVYWFINNYKTFDIDLQVVTDHSQEGSQFIHSFDGIAGILRQKVQKLFSDVEKNVEQIDINSCDYQFLND